MSSGFLSYKGRPLVRCKNQIFYGTPSNPQIVLISIDSEDDAHIPAKLSVGLVNSFAASKGSIFKPSKYSVKNSLFESLDLASAWLERSENDNK